MNRYWWDFVHGETEIIGVVIQSLTEDVVVLHTNDGYNLEYAESLVEDLNCGRISSKKVKERHVHRKSNQARI